MILVGFCSLAQRGIGTNDPHESTALEIKSADRSLLIPRVNLKHVLNKRIDGATSPESAEGLLIYNTRTTPSFVLDKGFYYWTGSKWARLLTDNDNININDVLAKTYTSSEVATQNLGNDDMLPLGGTFIVKASGVFASAKTLEVVLPTITDVHHGVKYTIVRDKVSTMGKLNVRVLPGTSDRIDGGFLAKSIINPRRLILQAEYVSGGISRWHVIDVTPFETVNSFERVFGGDESDQCYSVIQTGDGGYVMAGYNSFKGAGMEDFWLIKTDASGTKIWDRTFGGGQEDQCYSVIQTSDGGYALAGITESKGAGLVDFWLVKTDANGTKTWDKTFGGTNSDKCYSVIQTSDGGYALAGETRSKGSGNFDIWLVKTDASGNKTWDKTFGERRPEHCYQVIQTSDGGYALAGKTRSKGAGSYDIWLVKTDKDGNKSWDKTYGGSANDQCLSVVQTSDGGYALGGHTSSKGAGNSDFWLVKTDASGNESWDKTFGGGRFDYAYAIVQTIDGGYALGGHTSSKGAGSNDFWLVKTDASGNESWDKTFGGTGSDYLRSIFQTSDGNYVLGGHTSSKGAGRHDVWIIKYKP